MPLGKIESKPEQQQKAIEKRFENTDLKKKIDIDESNNDAVIQVLLPGRDKIAFTQHCKRIGTSTSNKLRELLFKYMETNGLR